MTPSPAIAAFMERAEAYHAAVRRLASEPSALDELQRGLARLYAAALELPLDAQPGVGPNPASARLVDSVLAAVPFDYYWDALEPLRFDVEDPQLGVCSFIDDLLDIDADVAAGMQLYRAGHYEAAAWSWRSSFWSHWAEHAVGAQRALLAYLQGL